MKEEQLNPFILCVAASLAATFLLHQNQQLQTKLDNCNSKYDGFREGVIYGK